MLFGINDKAKDSHRPSDNFLKKCIVKKQSVNNQKYVIKKCNVSDILANIELLDKQYLSKYQNDCDLVTDVSILNDYCKKIQGNIFAIDVETSGLNPMLDDIIGFSLYTPNEKAIYVPLKHKNHLYMTDVKENISIEDASKALNSIKNAFCIMFNANFDKRFLYHSLGVDFNVYWDCFIFQRVFYNGLYDKKGENGLKQCYARAKGLDSNDVLSYDNYFSNIDFCLVPPRLCYKYAAMDAKMTYELYQYQVIEGHKKENSGLYDIFFNLEMALLPYVIEMEDTGILFDINYNQELKQKYANLLQEQEHKCYQSLEHYKNKIDRYRKVTLNDCKLSDPILLTSPSQISILLYDIIGVDIGNNKKGTGEDILKKIDIPFTNELLKLREISKLLSTYIEAMPQSVNINTGRIHTRFNQVGTDTGRFSSDSPNLQNIPSRNKEIRKMFIPSQGCYLISCDYSSQEPRIIAELSKDQNMIKAFNNGYDYYSFLAANAYNKDYEYCKEFLPDGTPNPEGKKLRTDSKQGFLGLCYGSGATTLAETLKVSVEKSKNVMEKVLKAAPGLKKLIESSKQKGKKQGYIDTIWGRRRYLPNINLPYYNIDIDTTKVKLSSSFNPFSFDEEDEDVDIYADIKTYWLEKLKKARYFKDYISIQQEARQQGVIISDNSNYITKDERIAVNTQVQGSAADMTKIGMLNIFRNDELRQLGFRLILTVHDEVIGECPIENVKKVIGIIEDCMLIHTKDFCIPFKVDFEISDRWSGIPIKVEEL